MAKRVSWKDWSRWQELYDHWVKVYGKEHINLKWPSLRGLYDWLMRELKAHPEVDIETLDIKSYITPELTYEDAKRILKSLIGTPPSEEEYGEMYEAEKAMLEKQVREKYPEIIEPLEEKIIELEEKLEKEKARGKRKFAKIKELEEKLAETERQLEKEKKIKKEVKPPKIAPVKLRILKPFTEGIIDYTPGSVIETWDLDWAMDKIEKGYAERVPVTVPVKVVKPPPAKPPEKVPKAKVLPPVPEVCPIDGTPLEEVKRVPLLIKDPLRLTPEEAYWRARAGIPLPTKHVEWIDVPETMRVWMCHGPSKGYPTHYFERDARGRLVQRTPEYLYKKIIRETAKLRKIMAPPAPPPTPLPREVETRFRAWMRRYVPPPKEMKAIQLHPRDWLLRKGISFSDFLRLPESERKRLMDEYLREVREGR